jgi:hypothetical protein
VDYLETLFKNLARRNIRGLFAADRVAASQVILGLIPVTATVGFGNSATVKALGLAEALAERGNTVLDKTSASAPAESRALKLAALLADWFITSANAVSLDGRLVNIDHSGNRVAGMLYGPEHVLVVAGVNKVAATYEEALARVRNVAAPQNARRAGFRPPCLEAGRCVDCHSPERVCNSLVVIEGQSDPERLTVLMINEELGF